MEMSLQNLFNSASPFLVAGLGGVTLASLPLGTVATAAAPLGLLQAANVTAFCLNCVAVSVPGRIDGQQDQDMRQGRTLNPNKPESTMQNKSSEATPLQQSDSSYDRTYSPSRGRTLVSPSGWAFAIWGPIYLGETLFVASQFVPQLGMSAALPTVTAPFVAANIFQSLWCVCFRPSYTDWASYISPCMLAGTAYSLSMVHAYTTSAAAAWTAPWFLLMPMSVHFGWTSAATLVNLNGSVAMETSNGNRAVTAVGHGSALLATVLGVGLTVARSSPVYGFTLAWALSACADGMKKRSQTMENQSQRLSEDLKTATKVQEKLCWTGAAACVLASAYTLLS